MAELAYAHDSGSCPCTWMRVQVPSTALLLKINLAIAIYIHEMNTYD